MRVLEISIHALREEGDEIAATDLFSSVNFNPRPPRGGRPSIFFTLLGIVIFQSTPSARRATNDFGACKHVMDISIHALREEGDAFRLADDRRQVISIHALREEGDAHPGVSGTLPTYFNPRPPRGGRLYDREGQAPEIEFQSTPSARRATWAVTFITAAEVLFQSTPSARRATNLKLGYGGTQAISIHALREEGDLQGTR